MNFKEFFQAVIQSNTAKAGLALAIYGCLVAAGLNDNFLQAFLYIAAGFGVVNLRVLAYNAPPKTK